MSMHLQRRRAYDGRVMHVTHAQTQHVSHRLAPARRDTDVLRATLSVRPSHLADDRLHHDRRRWRATSNE